MQALLWPTGTEAGLWIDPSTTTASYQDSAGTTALSAIGTVLDTSNPVGLMLDQKAGGELGPELVTNGNFPYDCLDAGFNALYPGYVRSNCTLSVTEGVLRITPTTTNPALRFPAVATTAGKRYKVVATMAATSGSNRYIQAGTSAGGSQLVSVNVGTTGGAKQLVFTATTTTSYLNLATFDDTGYTEWDNISVREIPGIHLSQATSAARPVASARKNLLVGTDTLATQSVTVLASQCVLSFTGTGTVTLSGTSTAGPLAGTGAADRVSLTFTPTAGSLTLTVSGSVTLAQLEYRA